MKGLKIFFMSILAVTFHTISPETPTLSKSVQNLTEAYQKVKQQFSGSQSTARRARSSVDPNIVKKIDDARTVFVDFLASNKYTTENDLADRFVSAKHKLDEIGHYLQTMLKNKELKNKIESTMKEPAKIPEHHTTPELHEMPHLSTPPHLETPHVAAQPTHLEQPHLEAPHLETTHHEIPHLEAPAMHLKPLHLPAAHIDATPEPTDHSPSQHLEKENHEAMPHEAISKTPPTLEHKTLEPSPHLQESKRGSMPEHAIDKTTTHSSAHTGSTL